MHTIKHKTMRAIKHLRRILLLIKTCNYELSFGLSDEQQLIN